MPRFLHLPSSRIIVSDNHSQSSRYRRSANFSELPPTATDNHSRSSTFSPNTSDEAAESPLDHGTVTEILEWVGTNPQRRQAALTAELQGKHRVTLIRALQP